MGSAGQGRMTTHQQKKLDAEALRAFRDRFCLPLTDAQAEALEFVTALHRRFNPTRQELLALPPDGAPDR